MFRLAVPLTIQMIRRDTRHVILPGEEKPLAEHMNKRRKEGVRINLNHLGEAIFGRTRGTAPLANLSG